VILKATDIPMIDKMIAEAASSFTNEATSHATAVIRVAMEHPDLFSARARLRTGKSSAEDVAPFRFVGSSIVRSGDPVKDASTLREALTEARGFPMNRFYGGTGSMTESLNAIDSEIARMQAKHPDQSRANCFKILMADRPDLFNAQGEAARRSAAGRENEGRLL